MFDSVILDVFIGLVFLYLLYSLLVSIIGEMISGWLGLRSRLLRKALETMLNDASIPERWHLRMLRQLGSFVLYESHLFPSSFAGKFYDHPSIKYLTSSKKRNRFSFQQGKPSYISREAFTDTIIQMIRNKGNGADDMEKISFSLKFNTLHIQPQTLAHFRNLLADSGNDPGVFKEKLRQWYNETMDRTNGWYKKKLQLILFWLGFIIALTFNVDSIKIARQLASDKDARNQMVDLGIQASKENTAIGLAVNRKIDSTTSDSLLRRSYLEVKKAADQANQVLGLGWQLENRLTSVQYTREIYSATLGALEHQLINPARDLVHAIQFQKKLVAGMKDEGKKKRYMEALKQKTDSLAFLIHRFNVVTVSGFALTDSIHIGTVQQQGNTLNVIFSGKCGYTYWDKAGYVLCRSLPWRISFWGFVITALMISLGAPFWFDLLKKLVSIRSTGIKPEEKVPEPLATGDAAPGAKDPANSITQVQKPNPPPAPEDHIQAALRIYEEDIKRETGVIRVAQGYLKKGNDIVKCIQVNVTNSESAVVVRNKYGRLRTGENIFIPVEVIITGKPALTASGPGGGIPEKGVCNQVNYPDALGSFACFVQDKYFPDKKYLLTCYHVVNGDDSWDDHHAHNTIVNFRNEVISSHYMGYLNNHLDTALVEVTQDTIDYYKSIRDIGINPAGVKTVTENDVYATEVFFKGFTTGRSAGTVIHDSWSENFPYGSNMNFFEDLILIARRDQEHQQSTISGAGDSGSLLLDNENNAVGIVFAGDFVHTYAIKMTTILNELGMKLLI